MTTLETGPHVSLPANRRRLLWAGRTVFDVVLTGEQTSGAVALLDQTAERGDTTPLHVHRSELEIFYVLEGEIAAWFGGGVQELGPGAAICLPPDRPHAFGVVSDRARLLTVTSPAGFADFVAQAGVPVEGDPPESWEFDLTRLLEAAPSHGIEIVGPPPPLPGD